VEALYQHKNSDNSETESLKRFSKVDFPMNNSFEEYQLETWLQGEPILIEWHLKDKRRLIEN